MHKLTCTFAFPTLCVLARDDLTFWRDWRSRAGGHIEPAGARQRPNGVASTMPPPGYRNHPNKGLGRGFHERKGSGVNGTVPTADVATPCPSGGYMYKVCIPSFMYPL